MLQLLFCEGSGEKGAPSALSPERRRPDVSFLQLSFESLEYIWFPGSIKVIIFSVSVESSSKSPPPAKTSISLYDLIYCVGNSTLIITGGHQIDYSWAAHRLKY